jgi:hypothetical protein
LLPHKSFYSTVAIGTSVTKTFTFYSKSLTVNVAAVAISGTNAKQFNVTKDACSGKVLKAKSSCTVQVTFAPTTTGVQKAQLSLYDDAYNSPHRASMAGTGN